MLTESPSTSTLGSVVEGRSDGLGLQQTVTVLLGKPSPQPWLALTSAAETFAAQPKPEGEYQFTQHVDWPEVALGQATVELK